MPNDPKYLSQVEMPNGVLLEIKDTVARQMATGGTHYIGKLYVDGTTYTHLIDGDTRSTVEIIGEGSAHSAVSASQGDIVLDDGKEYIYDGSIWELMGTDGLKAFAFADTGSVTVPTFSYGNPTPNYTGTAATVSVTSDNSGLVAAPTGTFTQPTFSKSVTFSGTIATENEDRPVSNTETVPTGAESYTPKGTITPPTISVATAGSTTTIKNPTSKTVVTAVASSDPSSTEATGAVTYMAYTENSETLSFKQLTVNTGASITTTNVTVKNGDAAYEATHTANDFSGTPVYLSANVPKNTGTASVTGTVSGTTTGGAYTPNKVTISAEYDKTTSITQGARSEGSVTKTVTPNTGS